MPYTQVANLDFADIKAALKDYMRAQSDFTDYDFEGSAITTFLDVLAYNTYYTAFNTNMVVNEMFLDSATLRDNVVSLAKQIGYRPRSATAPKATVNFVVDYQGSGVTPDTLVLKQGTGFVTNYDDTLYQYVVIEDQETPLVNNTATYEGIDIYQGTLLTQSYTINTALKNQRFIINNTGTDVSSIRVKVYKQQGDTSFLTFSSAENILNLDGTSEVYFVEEIEDENYEIFFGDGVFGKKLDNGSFVEITYLTTSADTTNGAKTFSFSGLIHDKINPSNSFPYNTSVTIVNASTGGAIPESVSSIKKQAPKSFATQDRAVTADDYVSIIKKVYASISDIITFGGEEDNPPEFGKVKIAIKPENASTISAYTKNEIVKALKNYSVASVTPVIVDPSILYIELNSTISFKTSKTTLTKSEIQSKAIQAVEDYIASAETEKFNGKFRHSRFASVIDGSDGSINSNITNVTLRKDFYPILNSTYYYELCFVNEFKDSCDASVMKSTGFVVSEYPSFTVYLEDDTFGKIDLYRLNSLTGEKVYLKKGVGDINYTHGEIKLYDLTIIKGSFTDNKIEIRVEPASRDVDAVRELYLDVDISKSNFSAVPE
tara:strand:- start:15735 stop:17543 length:1809 start_codon:yes stop_codon:yes gene_type:complete